jgi:hypothetical protein
MITNPDKLGQLGLGLGLLRKDEYSVFRGKKRRLLRGERVSKGISTVRLSARRTKTRRERVDYTAKVNFELYVQSLMSLSSAGDPCSKAW